MNLKKNKDGKYYYDIETSGSPCQDISQVEEVRKSIDSLSKTFGKMGLDLQGWHESFKSSEERALKVFGDLGD